MGENNRPMDFITLLIKDKLDFLAINGVKRINFIVRDLSEILTL